MGCPETSVTTKLRKVTFQKSEDLNRGGILNSREIIIRCLLRYTGWRGSHLTFDSVK